MRNFFPFMTASPEISGLRADFIYANYIIACLLPLFVIFLCIRMVSSTKKAGVLQSVTLYNILFPVWLLVWIPSPLWLLLVPLNFVIDYVVLYKSLPDDVELEKSAPGGGQGDKSFPGSVPRKAFCNTYAWKICAAGFAADFTGSLFLFAAFMVTSSRKLDSLRAVSHGLGINPFENAAAFLIVVAAILLSAYCIYRFDLHVLKRAGLSEEQGRKSALWLAVLTAPYLFLLPSELLFRWM